MKVQDCLEMFAVVGLNDRQSIFFLFHRELTLELTFTPMSLMKLQFYAAQTMKNQWSTLLGEAGGQGDDEEEDGLKVRHLMTKSTEIG